MYHEKFIPCLKGLRPSNFIELSSLLFSINVCSLITRQSPPKKWRHSIVNTRRSSATSGSLHNQFLQAKRVSYVRFELKVEITRYEKIYFRADCRVERNNTRLEERRVQMAFVDFPTLKHRSDFTFARTIIIVLRTRTGCTRGTMKARLKVRGTIDKNEAPFASRGSHMA